MSNYITKSSLLTGIRCPKLLWLKSKMPELASPTTASRLSAAAGTELGKLARSNYANGFLIEHVESPDIAVRETARHMAEAVPCPLYEAAFVHHGVLVRADILAPDHDEWRMVEVKSAGSVKEHHLIDCAIQLWVLEGAGIAVRQICVAHVDTGFEYAGDGNYSGLLVEKDVTEEVRGLLPEVPQWLATHLDVLVNPMPEIPMGSQCKPECQFMAHCESALPEYPVTLLPNAAKAISNLQKAGIEDVRDIPNGMLKSERHIRVWQVTRDGTPYVAPDLVRELSKLPYPRFYLDFETINFVIPRWAGTSPHQQLPFQWSCHIERPDLLIEHKEFLETTGQAPMRLFAETLIEALENDGPIIVFGTFEETILKQAIRLNPEFETPLLGIIDRLVNLLPWMREHYYHPAMKGSWSIKAILPTVAPHLDYAQLDDVRNGTLAQLAYLEIIDPETHASVRDMKIHNLLKYCELDTRAMVELVRFFTR